LSQQTLVVNDAQYDAPSQTTTQELDFNEFGIKLTLENIVEISDEIVYGADIATIFNAKTLIYSGQSSQITNVRLNGTESTTYSLTHNNTMEVQTVTMVTGTTANDTLTLNGLTFTDLAGNATGAEVAAAFSNGTTGRKAGDVVSVTVTGDYTITGTVGDYDMTNTAGSAALVLTASTASVLGDQDLVTITEKSGGNGGNLAASAAQTTAGATSNILTLSYTDNAGAAHSTNLTLANADFLIDSDSTITFEDAGISIDIHNYQTQTASEIAYLLATKYGVPGDDGSVGKLKVLQSESAQLGFQSGPTTEAFIKVNTLNVMTGSTGVDEGAAGEMIAVGSLITSSLADLGASSSDLEWQSVFSSLGAAIDDAIDYISTERAVFGSQINRLSFMTTNLQANSTNLQNSRSSIIDTDFAAETAALTKGQIMQQAATAMLAQANQMPNVILSLLK
jgi:flagellin